LSYGSKDIGWEMVAIIQAITDLRESYIERNSKRYQRPKTGNSKSNAGAGPRNWR
jgi:hypothetical protein